jgi:hypothetical protein
MDMESHITSIVPDGGVRVTSEVVKEVYNDLGGVLPFVWAETKLLRACSRVRLTARP